MATDGSPPKELFYERVCESYHAVDDFRMKLPGLLPVATGTAVFLLLSGDTVIGGDEGNRARVALLGIGIFGFLFTAGLLAYELFGIKKCHYLLVAGRQLERDLEVSGQFLSRPRELAGFINEPFASAIIYPASLAAWVFLALALISETAAGVAALVVFAVGCLGIYLGVKRVKINEEREELVMTVVDKGSQCGVAREDALRQWKDHCKRRPDRVTGVLDRVSARRLGKGNQWVDVTLARLEQQRALYRRRDSQNRQSDWFYPRSGGMWDRRTGGAGAGATSSADAAK